MVGGGLKKEKKPWIFFLALHIGYDEVMVNTFDKKKTEMSI